MDGLGSTSQSTRANSPTKNGMGGYTFGMPSPKSGTIFISRAHASAESYGKHSPGPGAYGNVSPEKVTKASQKFSFSRSDRKTIFDENERISKQASPGPAYNHPTTLKVQKLGKMGTFGTSVRPSLAKTSF